VHYTLLDCLLHSGGFLLRLLLCVAILKSGSMLRWRALFTLSGFQCGLAVALFAVSSHYEIYFWTYWVCAGVQSIFAIGVIHDIIRNVPGLNHMPKGIAAGYIGFAVAGIAGVLYLQHPSLSGSVVQAALTLGAAVNFAWYALLLAILAGISRLGFAWLPLPLNVTCGFVLLSISQTISSYTISNWPRYGAAIDRTNSLLSLVIVIFWVMCFYNKGLLHHHEQTRKRIPA